MKKYINSVLYLCAFAAFALFIDCSAKTPKISIITSVYDGDRFIDGFLEDIVCQTIFDQCELIIINANSPGHEEPIIKHYAQQYPNIIYHHLEYDPGLYGVWNIAIGLARGKYITNANIDDRLKHDCYEVHAKALDNNPQIDLVYSDYYITFHANKKFVEVKKAKSSDLPSFSIKNLWKKCLPNNHPMWRKSMHDKCGLFSEKYKSAGDMEMWFRAVKHGSKFLKVQGVYGLFYFNPKGISTSFANRARNKKESIEIRELYADLGD
ncbi:MAG TPA: glycosyltransferase [Candidatus Babeliales bacterium]|nr:glycosyltransferase [Candidatus Babeliales bacterium]